MTSEAQLKWARGPLANRADTFSVTPCPCRAQSSGGAHRYIYFFFDLLTGEMGIRTLGLMFLFWPNALVVPYAVCPTDVKMPVLDRERVTTSLDVAANQDPRPIIAKFCRAHKYSHWSCAQLQVKYFFFGQFPAAP